MTENEAMEILRISPEMKKKIPNLAEVYEVAVKALEENQQYRAIGTVEELKEAKEQFDNINSCANSVALCGLCDFETAKESVISTIKALKEKNVVKKQIDNNLYIECPSCGNIVTEDSYCQCGQYVK